MQEVIDFLLNEGYKPFPYSGRNMNGKTCLAISGEPSNLWTLAYALGQEDLFMPEPKTDNLGEGIVIYWPTLLWDGTDQNAD